MVKLISLIQQQLLVSNSPKKKQVTEAKERNLPRDMQSVLVQGEPNFDKNHNGTKKQGNMEGLQRFGTDGNFLDFPFKSPLLPLQATSNISTGMRWFKSHKVCCVSI